jgi:hypothetical protein
VDCVEKLKHDRRLVWYLYRLRHRSRTHVFLHNNKINPTINLVRNDAVSLGHYRGADKSLARPTFRCILFDGENISFDASLVMYINNTNIPPIMIINRIYENQNLLSL